MKENNLGRENYAMIHSLSPPISVFLLLSTTFERFRSLLSYISLVLLRVVCLACKTNDDMMVMMIFIVTIWRGSPIHLLIIEYHGISLGLCWVMGPWVSLQELLSEVGHSHPELQHALAALLLHILLPQTYKEEREVSHIYLGQCGQLLIYSTSNILPTYKCDDKEDTKYRPVSQTSVIWKLHEKIWRIDGLSSWKKIFWYKTNNLDSEISTCVLNTGFLL